MPALVLTMGGPMTRPKRRVAPQTDSRARAEALYRAAAAARHAPAVDQAQPWRWRLTGAFLDLYLDRDRTAQGDTLTPGQAALSCGIALHHARLTLAARGWRVSVDRCPDPAAPLHLARLRIDGPAAASPGTARLARAIRLRNADPRSLSGEPLDQQDLRLLIRAFQSHDVRVHALRPDQILALATAAAHAGDVTSAEARWHEELSLWAGGDRIVGAGERLRLPVRHAVHDRAATFLVLHGSGDDVRDWLYAGEALSAGWLAATQRGVSVLPLSAPVAQPAARRALRSAVSELDQPYAVLRLGRHALPAAPQARRLPVTQIIGRPLPLRG
ncbi:nitroreductase [Actinoplanes sp. NPDC024001]|uniref:nitroreductase n=1 Tax=Actinoplanes sp. NPDC024001 TaxID=3154598 RepID=UPI0033E851F9